MGRRALSLLELITVLAVTAVLTAMALPAVHDYAARATLTEAETQLDALESAMTLYAMDHEDNGGWWFFPPAICDEDMCGSQPGPDPRPVAFNEDIVGWRPDGDLYGSYWCGLYGSPWSVSWCRAFFDLDGDGDIFHADRWHHIQGPDDLQAVADSVNTGAAVSAYTVPRIYYCSGTSEGFPIPTGPDCR